MSRPRPSLILNWLRGDGWALLMLVGLFVWANLPLLIGKQFEHWDAEMEFAPFYHYIADLVRTGSLMGWNPFMSGGSPDFAEPQNGAASPLTLLFGLLAGPQQLAFHLYWLTFWFLGGLGMYVLARALRAPPWGALISALGFVLSGYYFGHAEHLSVQYTYTFMPWALWRLRAAMQSGRWLPACEAGAFWGAGALAGNPAAHLPLTFLLGVAGAAFLFPLPPDWAGRRRAMGTYLRTMGIFAVVGGVVMAPSYGAFMYEAAGYSERSQALPRDVVVGSYFGWSWLTGIFTPAYLPLHQAMPDWIGTDISTRPLYCGAIVLVLAAFATWRRRAWREWTILAAGLFCLAVSMGKTLPLRGWLYDYVPLTRFTRHPGMFRGAFILALTILAAVGSARIEAFRRHPRSRRWLHRLAIVTVGGAVLAVASYMWVDALAPDSISDSTSPMATWHLAAIWFGALLMLLAALRFPRALPWLPVALVALTLVDLAFAADCSLTVAYEDRPNTVWYMPTEPLDNLGAEGWNRAERRPDNRNLFTHRPAFFSYTATRNAIQDKWREDMDLIHFASGPNRTFFAAGDVPVVPDSLSAFAAFKERARALGTLPMVRSLPSDVVRGGNRPAQDLAGIANAPAAQPIPEEVVAYHANDLTLRVNAPADGNLLVTERWARSWRMTVNGQTVPNDAGDFIFRIVPVRAGQNTVVMHYAIGWWQALVALSWGTMGLLIVVALYRTIRQRKPAALALPAIPVAPALELVS